MSEKRKIPAPIIVVAIIALCYAGAMFWPTGSRQDTAGETPVDGQIEKSYIHGCDDVVTAQPHRTVMRQQSDAGPTAH